MSITEEELRLLNWRKARRSMGNGDCVEIASLGARVAVRDSKDPAGSILSYDTDTWRSFLAEARRGEADPAL